ncbi:hypothetical protein HSX10_12860 [Winogradskyella undariae]|uniref:hypothetical protein n=1 Tax=Winogradskyella undariae TaxID=1285465 RepID=UPI00156B54F5|nr:hypothetical protein [Winogradskyella undariae]NRR92461.1 hypothetical protein [Winogradskyella undariae]
MNIENALSKTKNILLNLSTSETKSEALDYLLANFNGCVVTRFSDIKNTEKSIRIFALGDITLLDVKSEDVFIIKEFSSNYENHSTSNLKMISEGQVPINVHNAGVFYRQLFEDENYFSKIETEHQFQHLTESTKQSVALRKGIYLSEITKGKSTKNEEQLHFKLLRCSTNLTGPTDNFRATDTYIVNKINEAVKFDFEKETELNHVLAQIYENKKKDKDHPKDVKAKIKAHSDKTKDMPTEGLIAFCTFYDTTNFDKLSPSKTNKFDRVYGKSSGLSRLLFKLKSFVNDATLVKEFSVTLYPNSVFLIPLSTNRLYTHEIRPSVLDIDLIPIRMGYVIRCSNLEAVYTNGQTYIKNEDERIKLEPMVTENLEDLRTSYYEENKTVKRVDYGKVHFSMNTGDYKKPIY